MYDRGYGVSLGESWRPPEMAQIYAKEGRGILDSLHCQRLAQDLNLFRGGREMKSTGDYDEAGRLWESYSCPSYTTCWGGRFVKPDADHFSITHDGVR